MLGDLKALEPSSAELYCRRTSVLFVEQVRIGVGGGGGGWSGAASPLAPSVGESRPDQLLIRPSAVRPAMLRAIFGLSLLLLQTR